ncbi:SWI/SNF complex 60 kDa subunit [Cladochytrium replicatum]|nr:SWI/SNF complex 60 kDa subunit [Cladochytrium replicatum]
MQLQEFEKKLDATITRKRLDVAEYPHKPPKNQKRVLRVFLSNLASDQFIPVNEHGEPEQFDRMNPPVPSWTLRIEGRLLDPPNSRKSQPNPPKFSTFVSRVAVRLFRDPSYAEGNIIEWYKQPNAPECDGFEIKRMGDRDVHAQILIYLANTQDRYRLREDLATLLDIHTDTKENIIMALWQYIKVNKLQDSEDKKRINCDAALEKVLKKSHFYFPDTPHIISGLLMPPDPVMLEYMIKVDKEYTISQYAYDIEVDVEDISRTKTFNVLAGNAQIQKDVSAIDEKIVSLIQGINHYKAKRDFMLAFAKDPVNFINQWIASQSRDLEILIGDERINREELRRSDFYTQQWVQEAVYNYLLRDGV